MAWLAKVAGVTLDGAARAAPLMHSMLEAESAGAKVHNGGNDVQAIKVYDVSGHAIAGPVSLLDFFGGNNGGSFSDISCERLCASTPVRPSTVHIPFPSSKSSVVFKRSLPACLGLPGLSLIQAGQPSTSQ